MSDGNDFDDRLRRALRNMAWAESADELAGRAIALAEAREQAALALRARIAQRRQRIAWLNVAAIILIALIGVGLLSRLSWQDWVAAPDVTAVAEDALAAEPIGLPDEAALLLICGVILLATIVWAMVNPPDPRGMPAGLRTT